MIKIAGIDISMNNLGICKATIFQDGSIKIDDLILVQPAKPDKETKKQVRKNSDDLRRFRWLHDELHKQIIDTDLISVEMPVGSKSARAMVSYAGCIGVLASVEKPMIEVTPTEVKLAGAGTKTATKDEMIEWATFKHPEAKWRVVSRKGVKQHTRDNEHLADGLATIYAAMKTDQFKMMMSFYNSNLTNK